MKKPELTPARMGTTTLLFAFVGLKLGGQLDWSWWWVLSPYWIAFPFVVTTSLWHRFRSRRRRRMLIHAGTDSSDLYRFVRENDEFVVKFFDAFSRDEELWKAVHPKAYRALKKLRADFRQRTKGVPRVR